jgi:general secretion pathway protein B
MSYILDALRKADAQRQRDPARGIHAQPLGASSLGPQARGGRGVRLWSAAAVGVVALSSAGWYLYRGKADDVVAPRQASAKSGERVPASMTTLAQAQTAPVVGNPGAAPAAVAPAPMPAPAISPAPVLNPPPVVNPPPVTNPAPAPGQPYPVPAPDPRATSQPNMRGAPQPQSGTPAGTPLTARSPAARVAPVTPGMAVAPRPAISAPVPPPPPTPPVAGLPADAPKLVLSGGVYSTNPAQRMLIVNGQVFNEGSEVAPGVKLEEIKARTVVLGFRGTRYTVAY